MKGELIKASERLVTLELAAQLFIFCVAVALIWRVWSICIAFITSSDAQKAKLFTALIGNVEVGNGKLKAAGTGLGITVIILVLAVIAMLIIGGEDFSQLFGPAMQQAQQ
ncbi:MAG: hypothetical protein V4709_06325 [Pseudomonadota bacterium]